MGGRVHHKVLKPRTRRYAGVGPNLKDVLFVPLPEIVGAEHTLWRRVCERRQAFAREGVPAGNVKDLDVRYVLASTLDAMVGTQCQLKENRYVKFCLL